MYATVVCTAAGPWGLISTIENLMADQAGESVRDFLHFCVRKCMMCAGGMEEPVLAAGYASDMDSVYDNFQDATDALPELAAAAAGPGELPGKLLLPICPSSCGHLCIKICACGRPECRQG